MNCTRETKLIVDGKVIHTKFHGEVRLDFILSAIGEWLGVLHENKEIEFLLFDYSDANLNLLDTEDTRKVALSSDALAQVNPNLKLVGVMSNESDHELASIWAAFTATSEGPFEYNDIAILDSLSEALYFIEEKLDAE